MLGNYIKDMSQKPLCNMRETIIFSSGRINLSAFTFRGAYIPT